MRKIIFMLIVLIMIGCYGCFYIVPFVPGHDVHVQDSYRFPNPIKLCKEDKKVSAHVNLISIQNRSYFFQFFR